MGFADERTIRATRKQHHCEGCRKRIDVGQPAIRWAGTSDGEFGSAHYHPECRAAEIELNKVYGTFHDEWMGLTDLEDADHAWMRADFPIVAERLGLPAPNSGGEDV